MPQKTERSATRAKGFEEPETDFQLLRQLGACVYGGGSFVAPGTPVEVMVG